MRKKEPHNLYSSLNIIRTMKSRKRRWTQHVTHGRDEMHAKLLSENPKERGLLLLLLLLLSHFPYAF
jgi:hypothetical protein